MEVILLLLMGIVDGCGGEWIHVTSTSLRKSSSARNDSTNLFSVGDEYPEFVCSRVHNLTMMSFVEKDDRSEDDVPRQPNNLLALQEKLRGQIEDRISNIGRSLTRDGKTHHIGFPSLEGALISMSLLVFALYLIKLVMKLISTIQYKKSGTDIFNVLSNIGRPILMDQNQQKRSIEAELSSWKIKDLMTGQHQFY